MPAYSILEAIGSVQQDAQTLQNGEASDGTDITQAELTLGQEYTEVGFLLTFYETV